MADEKGLYLFVTTKGAKSWRFKYRFGDRPDGKPGQVERKLVFGTYPDVTLQEARDARDDARRLLRQGVDPGVRRKQEKASIAASAAVTFEVIAREWHQLRRKALDARYSKQILERLELHAFPEIGSTPITEITAPMVLQVTRKVEKAGTHEMAHRVRSYMSDVFVHAISTGRAAADPAAVIRKALAPPDPKLRPAQRKIEQARAALKRIEDEPSYWPTKLSSRLLALTAARPGVIRWAERTEFEDLEGEHPRWRIPAEKMKLTRERKRDITFEFVIPLSSQAVELVKLAMATSTSKQLLFPAVRDVNRPLSDSTMSKHYRTAGLTGAHVPHGWRSSFSTIMNEIAATEGRESDRAIIDMMLAHVPDGVEAVYNRASYMPRRREISQAWADLLLKGAALPAELLLGKKRDQKRAEPEHDGAGDRPDPQGGQRKPAGKNART
jgi:hypothetical protein